MAKEGPKEMERFDRSFVVQLIQSFVVALTAVIVIEVGARLAFGLWEYASEDRDRAEIAAERLASDVRDIMLNRGGPVAARTVYPILKQNYEELGLEIAILPTSVTVRSIEGRYGFTPRGIPAEWPEGAHHETRVPLEAQEFCLSCHGEAEVGDVLGEVVVRRYRDHRVAEWWSEARVAGVLGMANVILHTLVLFLLLRSRMEPLMSLRSMVGRLAGGRLDLSQRAGVKSEDEFGALACDLNDFLDRLTDLLEDLHGVLASVAAVNTRLGAVSGRMDEQVEAMHGRVRRAMRHLFEAQNAEGEERREALVSLGEELVELSRHASDDGHYMAEIGLLEQRMEDVARSGEAILERIRYDARDETEGSDAPPPGVSGGSSEPRSRSS